MKPDTNTRQVFPNKKLYNFEKPILYNDNRVSELNLKNSQPLSVQESSVDSSEVVSVNRWLTENGRGQLGGKIVTEFQMSCDSSEVANVSLIDVLPCEERSK